MPRNLLGFGMIVVALPLFVVPVRGEEVSIAVSKVPAEPRKAAEKEAPGVKFTKATGDQIEKRYKLKGKDDKGRNLQVMVLADGTVMSIGTWTPIKMDEVPKEVADAFEAGKAGDGPLMKGFKVEKVFRFDFRPPGMQETTPVYHFVGKNSRKARIVTVYSNLGSPLGTREVSPKTDDF